MKPIKIEHLFGNYKLIVGRLERFSDQYLLTAKLINSITGIKDAEISISGSFENLQSTGVDQLVSEFASAISKNSLRWLLLYSLLKILYGLIILAVTLS